MFLVDWEFTPIFFVALCVRSRNRQVISVWRRIYGHKIPSFVIRLFKNTQYPRFMVGLFHLKCFQNGMVNAGTLSSTWAFIFSLFGPYLSSTHLFHKMDNTTVVVIFFPHVYQVFEHLIDRAGQKKRNTKGISRLQRIV